MKIGVLTFHRAHNYGAVLQCYALQVVLKSMGHEVEVIDYRQKFIEQAYSSFRLRGFIAKCIKLQKDVFQDIFCIKKRKQRKKRYCDFLTRYIRTSNPCTIHNVPTSYSVIVVGSDQMWNPVLTGGVDPVYWGFFAKEHTCQMVGYAVSSNIKQLSLVSTDTVKLALSCFKAFSVREADLADFMNKRYEPQIHIENVIDPTLLADKEVWHPLINERFRSKRYIVVYQARTYKKRPDVLMEKASELGRMMNCEIINLSGNEYSPSDFVSAFRYASFVITTSFHAVAFSLIFNRPLYAVKLNDGYDSRYVDLLERVNGTEMLVDVDFMPQPIEADYTEINKALNQFRKNSMDFIRANISE